MGRVRDGKCNGYTCIRTKHTYMQVVPAFTSGVRVDVQTDVIDNSVAGQIAKYMYIKC